MYSLLNEQDMMDTSHTDVLLVRRVDKFPAVTVGTRSDLCR